jgi:hypothetical protein
VLARAQPAHGALVVGAAGQVVPAEPLDRDDRTTRESGGRRGHGVGRTRGRGWGAPVGRDQPRGRPARGAGVRLGVEASVGRVLVLGAAERAHLEAGHGGQRPVVGDAADDREAGTAVRAVDERVAVAAIGRIEQLGQAALAGGGVRRDRRRGRAAGGAGHDRELLLPEGRQLLAPDPLDPGKRRRLARQAHEEGVDRGRLSLELDRRAPHVVPDPPAQAKLAGQAVDERSEADALDRALDPRPDAAAGDRRPGRRRPTAHRAAPAGSSRSTSSRSTW